MGACAILPRIIGQGRASELLFTGRVMSAEEGERWGFHNRLVAAGRLLDEAQALARSLADGPTFAHGITKTQLHTEWAVSLDVAIEMEAQAQAICMATNDFRRAFEAFAAKQNARVQGRLMADRTFLDWPFFDDSHRALAAELEAWCEAELADAHGEGCRRRVPRVSSRKLGAGRLAALLRSRRPMAASTTRSTSARSP